MTDETITSLIRNLCTVRYAHTDQCWCCADIARVMKAVVAAAYDDALGMTKRQMQAKIRSLRRPVDTLGPSP